MSSLSRLVRSAGSARPNPLPAAVIAMYQVYICLERFGDDKPCLFAEASAWTLRGMLMPTGVNNSLNTFLTPNIISSIVQLQVFRPDAGTTVLKKAYVMFLAGWSTSPSKRNEFGGNRVKALRTCSRVPHIPVPHILVFTRN